MYRPIPVICCLHGGRCSWRAASPTSEMVPLGLNASSIFFFMFQLRSDEWAEVAALQSTSSSLDGFNNNNVCQSICDVYMAFQRMVRFRVRVNPNPNSVSR